MSKKEDFINTGNLEHEERDNLPPPSNFTNIGNLQKDKLGSQARVSSSNKSSKPNCEVLSDPYKFAEQPAESGCGVSKFKLVAVPTSQGCLGKNKGCEKAPAEILKDYDYSFADVAQDDFVEMMKGLENLEGDVFVGGDHSITYGLVKSFVRKRKSSERAGLIVFDAHPDCVNNFSPPTHEDFIRVLIEEGVVDAENVLLVGLRKLDEIEKKFLDERRVKYVCWGSDVNGILKDFVSKMDVIYLSIDIDVLSSYFAPGTGYVEEGGFSLTELEGYLKIVVESGKVSRSDLVEVNPLKDVERKTVESARKILRVLIER